MSDFWVFGYGSLMWRPGFAHRGAERALLYGYRRALCVRSFVHRGTEARPGLVLGLDRGGSCVGMAYRIDPEHREAVTRYLRERELVTHVYHERMLEVRRSNGERVKALGYIVDRHHIQYSGPLDVDEAARQVVGAVGKSGANEDYVANTVDHMRQLNIRDHWLERVAERISNGS